MKMLIIIMGILLLTINNTLAEIRINYGLKGGINYSSFTDTKNGFNPGKAFSITAEIKYKQFALQTELNYLKKSDIIKNKPIMPIGDIVYYWDIDCNISYLEIPVLLKYYIKIYKYIDLFLSGGFYYSYPFSDNSNVSNRSDFFFQIGNDAYPPPDDFKGFEYFVDNDPYETNDSFGYCFSSGLKWSLFMVEFRYGNSFNNIGSAGFISPVKKRFHSYTFLIGFIISR
jgi:hypothetical protein